jgi:hypothetical protein
VYVMNYVFIFLQITIQYSIAISANYVLRGASRVLRWWVWLQSVDSMTWPTLMTTSTFSALHFIEELNRNMRLNREKLCVNTGFRPEVYKICTLLPYAA